jgi:RNA polymerase sigma factor (TIGR02999 family)
MPPTGDQPSNPAVAFLIRTADAGDGAAADRLFVVLYDELHRLAERQLRRSGPELTLSATTLLHEAYLNIAGRDGVDFPDRARFLAYAARAMRGLVIDYARRRQAKKRGGEFHITSSGIEETPADADERPASLERLSEALDTLAEVDSRLAQLVDLHFFGGFSLGEIAAMRDVSERTIQRDWRKARLLLHRALQGDAGADLAP